MHINVFHYGELWTFPNRFATDEFFKHIFSPDCDIKRTFRGNNYHSKHEYINIEVLVPNNKVVRFLRHIKSMGIQHIRRHDYQNSIALMTTDGEMITAFEFEFDYFENYDEGETHD